jgi:DNA-binding CsgD family transcriptional regulator
VLATVARLSPDARRTVGIAALISGRFDADLLREVGSNPDDIDELLAAGLVVSEGPALRFRHEIVRLAVADEIPGFRKRVTHSRLLAALERSGDADVSQLAYHAEGAGDHAAVLNYAAAAGRRAAELGAHREAVAHFSTALRFDDGAAPQVAADLHQRLADEAALVERWHAAVEAGERSASLWGEVADPLREGDALRLRSAMTWRTAGGAQATLLAEQAVHRLTPLGPTRELARAYALLAALRVLSGDLTQATEDVTTARALADQLDLPDVLGHARTTEAVIAWNQGRPWEDPMQEALRIACAADAYEQAARTYANLHMILTASCDFRGADKCFEDGTDFCDRHELTTYGLYLRASHAASLARRGRWDEALTLAREVLAEHPVPTTAVEPTIVLGSLLVRRGDAAGLQLLDEAVVLATRADIAAVRCAAHVARAEAYWLAGDREAAVADIRIAAAVAESADPWARAAVAAWQRRLDSAITVAEDDAPEPFANARDGDSRAAARSWDDLNAPYDAALALLDAGTEPDLRQALQRFQALGAVAAERLTRRRMRALGIRGIPSGAHRSTRQNPAGLTRRELEVLIKVSAGLTNAQIAEDLVLSTRTVDHHVAALLTKLGAPSRALAVERARALGVLDSDGRSPREIRSSGTHI